MTSEVAGSLVGSLGKLTLVCFQKGKCSHPGGSDGNCEVGLMRDRKAQDEETGAGSGILTRTLGASQVVLVVKNPPANAGDLTDVGSIPGLGRSPGGGQGNPLQYSCLENPTDRGAWQATVGVRGLDMTEGTEHTHRQRGGWSTRQGIWSPKDWAEEPKKALSHRGSKSKQGSSQHAVRASGLSSAQPGQMASSCELEKAPPPAPHPRRCSAQMAASQTGPAQ